MDEKELIAALMMDIERNVFSMQSVLNRHLKEIESLKAEGVAYTKILALLNEKMEKPMQLTTFNTLLFRAKKKFKSVVPNTQVQAIEVKEEQKANNPTIDPEKKISGLKESIKDWRRKTNHITMSERTAMRLESHGINTGNIDELELESLPEIQKYLDDLKSIKTK